MNGYDNIINKAKKKSSKIEIVHNVNFESINISWIHVLLFRYITKIFRRIKR